MLILATIIVILGAIWLVTRLWAIRKHNRILYTMYNYRRDIMSLMRSDRIQENVDTNDYRKLRRTLDNANLVIEDFEKNEPSPVAFFQYIKHSGKQAFRADVRQSRLSLAENEEVKHQQKNLHRLLSWSVYYQTPAIFRNKSLVTFLLTAFGCQNNRKKKTQPPITYAEWVGTHVSSPLTKDFSAEI